MLKKILASKKPLKLTQLTKNLVGKKIDRDPERIKEEEKCTCFFLLSLYLFLFKILMPLTFPKLVLLTFIKIQTIFYYLK